MDSNTEKHMPFKGRPLKDNDISDINNIINFVVSVQCLVIYSVALVMYLCKSRFKMYLRTGFLIACYLMLFIS